jgi:hypothetical protein
MHCFAGRRGMNTCDPCGDESVPCPEQCPPCCPANKNGDHSKPLEHHHPPLVAVAATTPLPVCLKLSTGERLHGPDRSAHGADRPIYLTFCALLI